MGGRIVTRTRPTRQAPAKWMGFYGFGPASGLYKPRVTAQALSFWRRLGLAFSVFFRALFDERYALSLLAQHTGQAAGTVEPARAPGASAQRGAPAATTPARPEPGDTSALLLLSLLQTEGRFVDFAQQDIAGFPDADVGAVARVVHAGCRKVLNAYVHIEPILPEPEGQSVNLEPGFDPSRVKLTGKVGGEGRLRGVLRHRGWQATEVRLPTVLDAAGALVLCPAEVEL
jgi:uncharacterized protein DUF2760